MLELVLWLLRSFLKYWRHSDSSSSVFSTLVPSAFFTLVAAFDFPLSESSLTTLQTMLYWFFSAACLSSSSLFSRCFLSFEILICLVQLFIQVFTLLHLSVYLRWFVMQDKLGLVAFFMQLVSCIGDPVWGLLGLGGSNNRFSGCFHASLEFIIGVLHIIVRKNSLQRFKAVLQFQLEFFL